MGRIANDDVKLPAGRSIRLIRSPLLAFKALSSIY